MKICFVSVFVGVLVTLATLVWAQGDAGSQECLDVQHAVQATVGDETNPPYRNHGQYVREATHATNPALESGQITEECHSCIVNQFSHSIPIADQEACGEARVAVFVVIEPQSCTDILEPGVSASRLLQSGSTCALTLIGTNLEFSCQTCDVADFTSLSNQVGQGLPCGNRVIDIVQNDLQICARSTLTGNKWDIDFLTWGSRSSGCVDTNSGADCAAAGGNASYLRTPF